MAHKPTTKKREEVKTLSGYGLTQEMIASFLGLSIPTLRKHYPTQLKQGKAVAAAQVGSKLWDLIMAGDKAAIFFYYKTQMGARETSGIEHSGEVKGSGGSWSLATPIIPPKGTEGDE
jgi:hypothetical protein